MNCRLLILSALCGLLMLTGCEKAREAAETTRDTAGAVADKAGEMVADAEKMANGVKDVVAGTTTVGEEGFEAALNAAKAATAKAAKTGNEWRDTGKILKTAEQAAVDGDLAKAIKLANQARVQSEQAVIQAEAMQNAGPLF